MNQTFRYVQLPYIQYKLTDLEIKAVLILSFAWIVRNSMMIFLGNFCSISSNNCFCCCEENILFLDTVPLKHRVLNMCE